MLPWASVGMADTVMVSRVRRGGLWPVSAIVRMASHVPAARAREPF
jgi:hypothetical protein